MTPEERNNTWAEQRAIELLACSNPECRGDCGSPDKRQKTCPCYYRPAVAAALTEALFEGLRLAKELQNYAQHGDQCRWTTGTVYTCYCGLNKLNAEIAALERDKGPSKMG